MTIIQQPATGRQFATLGIVDRRTVRLSQQDIRIPTLTLLHHGGPEGPIEWNWEPTIVLGTALSVATYLYSAGVLRPRERGVEGVSSARVALFLFGTAVFFFSLVSPLDVLSDGYLFSAHMVQHILIGTIAPMFLLLGTPGHILRPVLKVPAALTCARILTFPACAFVLFNGTFWLWHLPALYERALAEEYVHAVQHLSFVATGLVNWWPVLSPMRELPGLSYPLRVLYLFINSQPGVALGALFFFSRDVFYRTYLAAPRVFDISAHGDQQIGGLIMWIPGSAPYLVALSVIFLRWLYQTEAK